MSMRARDNYFLSIKNAVWKESVATRGINLRVQVLHQTAFLWGTAFLYARCQGGGGFSYPSLPNSRTSGRSDAGEAALESSQRVTLKNVSNVFERSPVRFNVKISSLFTLSAAETGLMKAANKKNAQKFFKRYRS